MVYNAHNRHLDHFPQGNPLEGVEEVDFFGMDALEKVEQQQALAERTASALYS